MPLWKLPHNDPSGLRRQALIDQSGDGSGGPQLEGSGKSLEILSLLSFSNEILSVLMNY